LAVLLSSNKYSSIQHNIIAVPEEIAGLDRAGSYMYSVQSDMKGTVSTVPYGLLTLYKQSIHGF
jgi:hypothetical protein